MRNIRTVIVDDELLGRSRVKKLLADRENIQIIGEAANGEDASRMIADYRPDLVFLDVEMPDRDGIQVVSRIPEDQRPFVIFVTAHDRFALKAFDVQAVDFILKPFDDDRFYRAIDHAVRQIEMKDHHLLNAQLLRLVDDYRSKSQTNPYIFTIRDRGRERKVNLYDVIFIEADGNYLKFQLEKERFLVRNTMQQMIDELDHSCFLRIHRSLIINTNYLKVKTYRGNNEYVFKMRNGDEFISGRSFKESIDEYFASLTA